MRFPRLPRDPRWLQIAFLASFLTLGLCARDFPIWHAPLIFASALGTQLLCERLFKLPHAGLLSPLITSFGLTLLLRAGAWWVPPLAATLAISSKYLLRAREGHFLHPPQSRCARARATSSTRPTSASAA